MHQIEEQILAEIEKNQLISTKSIERLNSLPLGKLSRAFFESSKLKKYCKNNMLALRLALEAYIASNRSQPYLDKIETIMRRLPSALLSDKSKGQVDKIAGTYLRPVPDTLIRQIYLLENTALTDLFKKYFSIPPARLFAGDKIPAVIQRRELKASETLKKVSLKILEPFIIKAQRKTRMKRRYQEEINRIAKRDKGFLKKKRMSSKQFLQDANTPYKPKCDSELAERIMATAKKVSAFSTVKHITSEEALSSICDDALYSRRHLLDFYLSFTPAALKKSDVLNGDANVICLGPQNIDPRASGKIVIEFDLPKLIKNKPTAFFKQRDLEYQFDKIREVQLGSKTVSFNHTGFIRDADPEYTYLELMDNEPDELTRYAAVPKSSFIAYDLERMHEILTLNFFRFIDELTDGNDKPDPEYIDKFYQSLNRLTDEELLHFLTELEKNMTDTAEFNFYGAHQLDFSTIKSISTKKKGYTLHLAKFVKALDQGNMDEMRLAQEKIPGLFQSYRFIDYLLTKIHHLEMRHYLDDLRKQCKTPSWVQYTPLSIPKDSSLSSRVSSKPIEYSSRLFKESSMARDSDLTAIIKKAFSDLCSKTHFNTTSFCFASADIITALRQEPQLASFASSIDALQRLGELTKEELDRIIKTIVPDNVQLKDNIYRLYQQNKMNTKKAIRSEPDDATLTTKKSQRSGFNPPSSIALPPRTGLFFTTKTALQESTQELQLPIRSKL